MNTNLKKYSIYLQLNTQSAGNKAPAITVKLNDVEYTPSLQLENIVDFRMHGKLGDNLLTISLNNKTANDTVVDSESNIIQDLNVQVSKLEVDNIDVTNYTKNNNHYLTNDQETMNTHGFMHKNGTLSISLVCPGFYFFRNLSFLTC